jgi:hypothetical protein
MQKFSTFSERTIKYNYKPNASRFISEARDPEYDVILFFSESESFPHVSRDSIKIIGGRSSKRSVAPGKCLFDAIDLPESELPLFMQSLYGTREHTILIPLGKKILTVYNPWIRSGGVGIAFIFNYSPLCVSHILESEYQKLLPDILISPTFEGFPQKRGKSAIAFTNSLMGLIDKLNKNSSQGSVSADAAINIMRSAADLMDIPITVELQLDAMSDRYFDASALYSFSTSILYMARRLSADQVASIKISGGKQRSISVDFKLAEKADVRKEMTAALFCERMADELRVPFFIDIENGNFHSVFAPFREDPSLFGLKTGIFIDKKRLTPMT